VRFIKPITNFSSGELSENLFGRIDVQEYQAGLSYTSNCLLNPQGGAYKRVGSKQRQRVGNADDTDLVNILEFILENGTSILVEFAVGTTNGYTMRLLDSSIQELPYTISFVPSLTGTALLYGWNGVAIGSKIYMTNYTGQVQPFIIDVSNIANIRVDLINFSAFKSVPFLDSNNDSTKKMRLLSANTQGPYTLEANFNAFSADHVGSQIILTGITKLDATINDAMDSTTYNRLASDALFISAYISPTQVTVLPYYTYNFGIGLADLYDYPLVAKATTQWFDDWRFSAFSPINGYPKVFATFESRLIMAGTKLNNSTIYASAINNPNIMQGNRLQVPETQTFEIYNINGGDYQVSHSIINNNYNGDILPTDPYNFTIASKDSAPITWVEASRFGVVSTQNKQYFLDGDGSIVSQTNVSIRPFATKSASPLMAVALDNTVFYTDSTRTRIYMYLYNESNGSYISKEVTLLYGKFSTDNFITVMRFSREFSSIMCVTSQGDCVALAYNQETRTLGFTKFFESTDDLKMVDYVSLATPDYKDMGVACIKVPNGKMLYYTFSDALLLATIPADILSAYAEELNYLDRMFAYDGVSTDTIEYIDTFKDETIVIYATDGVTVDRYEVEHDGSFSLQLPKTYTGFAVGSKYAFEIATMPVEAGQAYETAQMGAKRIDQALIRTAHCANIKVGTDGYNYDLVPITDNKAVFEMMGNTELDHIVYIRHDDVGPCMINNITLRGVNNDG